MTVKISSSGQSPSPIFDRPFLLLVEGKDDSAFVERMLCFASVESSSWQVHEMLGNVTDWRGELEVILDTDEFDVMGKAIGLVMDADKDHASSLQRCINILARNGLPAPRQAEEIARDQRWRTGVYLMPGGGREGALEHLVLQGVDVERRDLATQYLTEAKRRRRSAYTHEAKSLVQAYLSAERSVVKTLWTAIQRGVVLDPSHDSLTAFRKFVLELEASGAQPRRQPPRLT